MNKETFKITKIVCPHCGAEYTVSEIYYPRELEGKTQSVVKDELGHILFVEESEVNKVQHYICDYCEKEFVVEANLNFSTFKTQLEFEEKEDDSNTIFREVEIFE